MTHIKSGMIGALLLLMLSADSHAKAWRGITPLKSTRTDVERLWGKPNELGRYEIEQERAYIFYSDGSCTGSNQNLAKVKCECLVARDTVLRVAVTLENGINFPRVNKSKFNRTPLRSNVPMSTYSDLDDGVVYRVNETDGLVTAIDYWPSNTDCDEIVRTHSAGLQSNVWRGILLLHSTRGDVERILGLPKRRSINQTYAYDTDEEKIYVLYSEGPCRPSEIGKWNVPTDTVLKIMIYPQRTVLVSELNLDQNKYRRGPDPNIRDWFYLVNPEEGIMIQSQVKNGCEQVMAITYQPSTQDKVQLCK